MSKRWQTDYKFELEEMKIIPPPTQAAREGLFEWIRPDDPHTEMVRKRIRTIRAAQKKYLGKRVSVKGYTAQALATVVYVLRRRKLMRRPPKASNPFASPLDAYVQWDDGGGYSLVPLGALCL